ncbi:MAG: hypothetical protein V3T23_12375 [Nitrososphaerales archaeon]
MSHENIQWPDIVCPMGTDHMSEQEKILAGLHRSSPTQVDGTEPTSANTGPTNCASFSFSAEGRNYTLTLSNSRQTAEGLKAHVTFCDTASGNTYAEPVLFYKSSSVQKFVRGCARKVGFGPGPLSDTFSQQIELQLDTLGKAHREAQQKPTQEPEITPDTMPPARRQAAEALLKDPNLFDRIKDDLTAIGIVGQMRQKMIVFTGVVSRLLDKGLALTIRADSSVGKSHLVNNVLSFFPKSAYMLRTQISKQYLSRLGEDTVKHKALVIGEAQGKDDADAFLRQLISEPYVETGTLVQDEMKSWKSVSFRLNGPIAYIDTTTSLYTHPENATRLGHVNLNAEAKQIRDIQAHKQYIAEQDSDSLAKAHAVIQQLHSDAQILLKPILVRVPFATLLPDLGDEPRASRDMDQLLLTIKAVACLHQYQRKIEKTALGNDFIEATVKDYAIAYWLFNQTLADSRGDLEPRAHEAWITIVKKVTRIVGSSGNLETHRFTRQDIFKLMGLPQTTVRARIKSLESKGYLLMPDGALVQGNRIRLGRKTEYIINTEMLSEAYPVPELLTPGDLQHKFDQVEATKSSEKNRGYLPEIAENPPGRGYPYNIIRETAREVLAKAGDFSVSP